jgi:DNA repair photolyase
MKQFKGKAIYNPAGKAGEYSKWACNFYTGCSNDCNYCYCKRGVLSSVWSDTPKLKSCFKDEVHALQVFEKELLKNIDEIRTSGLFFTFTSDPMLAETLELTMKAASLCRQMKVPTKILTKVAFNTDEFIEWVITEDKGYLNYLSFGFTLTGCDELEPGASSNEERITVMQKLHEAGFKTWASIEPIIDLNRSLEMIKQTIGFCDLYKVGLKSGKKYDWCELRGFMLACTPLNSKFYFKDSFIEQAKLDRNNLPVNCVTSDYNIFQ